MPEALSWSREFDIALDEVMVVEEIVGSGGGGQWSRFYQIRRCRAYFDALTH